MHKSVVLADLLILMADLDMTGIPWKALDLNGGSFDGNGHAILNLTLAEMGDLKKKCLAVNEAFLR